MRYLILLLILQSCSCDYHLRKAKQKCGIVNRTDTITVKDSILINSVRTDTLFKPLQGDTVYITKDRLKIKYVRLAGDSVFISGKCDSIYVYHEVKVPCESIILEGSKWYQNRVNWLIISLVLVGVGLIIKWIR